MTMTELLRRASAGCALVALAAGCRGAADAPASGPVPESSRLVVVGGALDPDNSAVYAAVLDALDGAGPLCVLPTASGIPEESMVAAVGAFRRQGADSVRGVFVTSGNPEAVRDPEVVARLRDCSGFWFVGGVQSRVVEVFLPGGQATPGYEAIMDRVHSGAVVAGSSAGAAIMPSRMIAGGVSADALNFGPVEREPEAADPPGVLIERGLGLRPGAVLDQHFLARGRIGRLLVATLAGVGGGVGIGLDENTALVVDGGSGRVVGASGVVVVDARGADRQGAGHGGRRVRIHLVGSGDVVDMESLTVARGHGKRPLPVELESVDPPPDVFAPWAFLHLVHDLARATSDSVSTASAGYVLILRKAPDFEAVAYDAEGVRGTPQGLSAGPLLLSLVPEE